MVSLCSNQHMSNVLQEWKNMGLEVTPLDLRDQPNRISTHPTSGGLQRDRRIVDNKSWITPLNTTDITASPRPSYLVDYASFDITTTQALPGTSSSDVCSHYVLQFKLLADQSLQHLYVVPSAQYSTMKHCFHDHTAVGVHLLSTEHLPTTLNLPVSSTRDPSIAEQLTGWVPATDSGWKYYDDEMRGWLMQSYPDMVQRC